MTALRQQMIQDMVVRGFSEHTHRAYLRAVAELARFYGRSPDRLSEREIQRYLVQLNQERGLSHSTCNQVAVALGSKPPRELTLSGPIGPYYACRGPYSSYAPDPELQPFQLQQLVSDRTGFRPGSVSTPNSHYVTFGSTPESR